MMIGDVDMENGKNVIEKKLRIQLFVAIIIYAVVGYLIGSLFSGSENPILMWIYLRIDVIYFLLILFFKDLTSSLTHLLLEVLHTMTIYIE